MFSVGMSSSFSVYVFLFGFASSFARFFSFNCWDGGGPVFLLLDLDLETPSVSDRFAPPFPGAPDLPPACLFLIVRVGAIAIDGYG